MNCDEAFRNRVIDNLKSFDVISHQDDPALRRAAVAVVIASSHRLTHLVEAGQVDVAIMQVTDDGLLADDRVLWTDDLRWVSCCETPYAEGPVPMITFGDDCFYRTASEPLLEANGIETFLKNEFLSGALGELPFQEVAPQVFVLHEKDLPRAVELLAEDAGEDS